MNIKRLASAMNYVVRRIRTDLVMQVAFVKAPSGGFWWIWITEAGAKSIVWRMAFYEGHLNEVVLPSSLTTEGD